MVNRGKSDKGITILALVVTIIVLLILAGITLATLTGENGILTKAKTAKEEYKKAQYEEAINFAKLQAHTEQGKYKIDAEKFLQRVREILQKNELFKDAKTSEEKAEAWNIESKVDDDDNKWKLTIITAEDWYYYVTEENTKYIGIEEEIKTVIDKDIAFSYDDRWTQGPIIVTIEKVKPKEHEEYQIEYSYDEMTWQDYTTPIEIYKNQYIYARLTDNKGNNVTRSNAKEKITKIDKLKPEEFNINKDEAIITTDSITIMGETTDAMATEDYGQSGIETYQFSINGGAWATNKNIEQTSYTFTGLTQNTTYKIKMKAIDHAGNERKTEEIEVTTAGIPDLREEDEGSKRANVTFIHDPVGWTNGNVTVTIDTTEKGYILQYNIGDRNREEDWRNYDSPVVMTENGSIYARLKDNANNKGEAIEHKITNIERVKPTIQIQANTTAISQTKQITITAEDTGGSELLDANYYQYYLSTSGAELLGGSWQNYRSGTPFTIGSELNGTYYLWVKQIADNAGNKSETNNGSYHVSSAYTFDNTAPKCTITTNVNSPTNASSITYTFEWSETLANNTFTVDDITVTNGSKGTFTTITANKKYTLVVTNTGTCEQTISVPAGKCTDTAGNNNTEVRKAMTIDRTAPKCTITTNVNNLTNASSITYTFTWSKTLANNTFTAEDITVTNGTKGTFTTVTANKVYTLVVTNTGTCEQTVSVAGGKCTDTVGNNNIQASKTITINRTAPKCTITANKNSPTNANSITYTFTWDKILANNTFTADDITVTNGTKGAFTTITANKEYTLVVTNTNTGDYTQKVEVAEGKCTDTFGNNNTAISKEIKIDKTAPTCTITANVNNTTNANSVTYTFTWSETLANNTFAAEDITITNGTKGLFKTITANKVYTLVVTNTGEGMQKVEIPQGKCKDLAGNDNTTASKQVLIDRTAPTCTITANVNSPTNADSIIYTFTWSETLASNTFTIEDITVTNGTKGTFKEVTANKVYTLQVINGDLTDFVQKVKLESGTCMDLAGNSNLEASKTVTVDRTLPTCKITADVESLTNASSVMYTFTFSEEVTGFTVEDINVNKGSKGRLVPLSSSVYQLSITDTDHVEYNQIVSVAAGSCQDLAGNGNEAATKEIKIDRKAPECTITANVESPTNANSIEYSFTFTEPVTDFEEDDITVSNGVKGTLEFSRSLGKYILIVTNTGSCEQTISVKANSYSDMAGNYNTSSTSKTVIVDRTGPEIQINPDSDTTYTKTKTIGITVTDKYSNIKDITIEYGWSESLTTPPNLYKTLTYQTNNHEMNSFTFPLTNEGANLNGIHYLWVKPVVLEDVLGNRNTTIKKSKAFYFDNEAPEINASSDSNYSKMKNVIVTITDKNSGLASGGKVQYGWSKDLDQEPSYYETVSLNNIAGAKSTTFTAIQRTGYTGTHYLWIKPITTSLKDVAGNSNITTVQKGPYYFDNTAPKINILLDSNTNYSKEHSVGVRITDDHSQLASGGSVQYGWSESLIEAPSSYQTEQLTYQNGVGSIAFTAKTQEGIPTGKYYLWVKPINLKDIAGNNCTTIAKSTGQFYIDSTAPTIGTATSSLTIVAGNSGMISVSNIADTGGSGITGYYIKKQAPSETTAPLVPTANDSGWVSLSSSSFNYMLASATQSDAGRYYIWVKDGAGNVSGVKICQVTVQTAVAQVVGVLNGNRASVQDAIDTCLNAGQSTVKLLVNNQPTKKITVKDNEQIILDLNTKTLTGKIETQEGANITIQNGTMSATTDNVHVVYNMGTTTIKCKVEGRNDTSTAPIVNKKGTLTLGSGCTVTVYHSSNAIYTYGGQTIISGATIKGYSRKATIYNNGILTVNSGTCTGITAPAINNAASGTLNIKGGTLTSNSTTKATATVKNAGTTKFTKGTIRNTGSGGYAIYNTGSWTGKASATDGRVVSGNTSY